MDLITTAAEVYPVPETAVVYPTTAWMGTERGIAAPVPLVQYDDTLPILAVALRLNGQAFTVPEGAAVNIRMDKRDGHYVYNPALGVSEDRQTAYISVTLQMTTGAGEFWPTIEIVLDGQVAGTSYIPLRIRQNPVPEDAIESTDEYKTIQELVEEVKKAAQIITDNEQAIKDIEENLPAIQGAAGNAEAAKAGATLAESWAVGGTGTRSGEDTDNAKYYAELAQQVSQGAVGYYETGDALKADHPTGQAGNWAIVGDTDTIWVWDTESNTWLDTSQNVNMSNYYTKAQSDARYYTKTESDDRYAKASEIVGVMKRLMPVGSIVEWSPVDGDSTDLSTPEKVADYYGFGTWEAIQDCFVRGADAQHPAGSTGGSWKHTQTTAEMVRHDHTLYTQDGGSSQSEGKSVLAPGWSNTWRNFGSSVTASGEGQPMDITNPYYSAYIWRRIA